MALLMSFKVDVKAMTVTVTKRFLKSDSFTKSAAVGKLVSCRDNVTYIQPPRQFGTDVRGFAVSLGVQKTI